MKKIFRLAALVMAGSLLFMACGKDDPKKPHGPNNEGGDGGKTEAKAPAIVLDGAFADWDAITEEVAKANEFAAMYKSDDVDDPIQVMKITCDADNIYFYIDFNAAGLPQNVTCSEWGDSWNGTPEAGYKNPATEDEDKFRETVYLFIDPDGNDRTGFYTFNDGEGEPSIPGLGCEMGVCWFAFYNFNTKKVSMAWNQNNIGPYMTGTVEYNADGERTNYITNGVYDYNGTFFLEWPDEGENAALPLWGWLNDANDGAGDNIAPSKTNWFPAEAVGTSAKVEFAVEKKDITKLPDEAEEIAVGIEVKWGSVDQPVGPLRISYVD